MFAPKIDEIRFVTADGRVIARFHVVAQLAALGYKDTPKNRDVICEKAIEDLRRPGIKIVAVTRDGSQN